MARESGSGKNVTLSDVAKAAGVAPMTVSRFLNDHPNISAKTKKKVSAAIKHLNYTPNLAARILMGQPSNTIGLIVPTLSDAFFSEIAHTIQASARDRGKLVWVAATDGDPEIEASVLEQMKQHHVDGILLVPTAAFTSLPATIPLVSLDRPLQTECDTILVDNRGGAAKLVEHLVSHRYKRILCISTDPPSLYTIGERIAGYQDVIRKHGLAMMIQSSLKSKDELADCVRAALKSASAPQAIFSTNNVTTIHLLETLMDDGVEFPKDVAVGGFDDFEFARLVRPGITVVRQPARDLGRQAAHLLFERLAQTDSRVHSITTTLPTTLVIRASCGCEPTR